MAEEKNIIKEIQVQEKDYLLGVHTDNIEGVLSIPQGGTGLEVSPQASVNLEKEITEGKENLFQGDVELGISGVLSLEHGGTGVNFGADPSMIIDLANENSDTIFKNLSTPGVTGILSQEHGGTGVGSLKEMRDLSYLGQNPITLAEDTPIKWMSLGCGVALIEQVSASDGNILKNQPTTRGFLINLPTPNDYLVTQTFIAIDDGKPQEWKRVGNQTGWENNEQWIKNYSTVDTIPLTNGGTGSSVSLVNAPGYSIVRKHATGDSLHYITPAKGVLHQTSDIAAPAFGTIPISVGGTAAESAAGARTNLGFEYGESAPTSTPKTGDGAVYFKKFNRAEELASLIELPTNTVPVSDTPAEWRKLGNFQAYYNGSSTVINKPGTYGLLINITTAVGIIQIWHRQGMYGTLYTRAGNSSGWNGSSSVSGADAWVRTNPFGDGLAVDDIPSNAIIRRTGDGTTGLYYERVQPGAFYATTTDGYPKFGTLPVGQGGTGTDTRRVEVTFSGSSTNVTGLVGSIYAMPYSRMCSIRLYMETKTALSADTTYTLATINSAFKDYLPETTTPLAIYCSKQGNIDITATDGIIQIRTHESIPAGYAIRVGGCWHYTPS